MEKAHSAGMNTLRGYWLSALVIGVLLIGMAVLSASQSASTPSRSASASAAAWNRYLAEVNAQSARNAAAAQAADEAFQHQTARDSARISRHDEAWARRAGEPDSQPTSPQQTAQRGAKAATLSAQANGGQSAGTHRLSTGQVQAAEAGAVAMLKVCVDESAGDWTAAKSDTGPAAKGYVALKNALFQDPNTRYPEPSYNGKVTVMVSMRELAAEVASNAGSGGGCGLYGGEMQTALSALPR